MSGFTDTVAMKQTQIGADVWQLTEDLVYYVGFEGSDEKIIVPKGFQSDGASVPRIVWPIVGHPFQGDYCAAAWIHDWIYGTHIYQRKPGDEIFLEGMEVLGCWWWKRNVMWCSVRQFGSGAYNKSLPIINANRHLAGLEPLGEQFKINE